jgi:hypothetical protein
MSREPLRPERALILVALAAGLGAGCSGSSPTQSTGASGNEPGTTLTGRHSFDVLATLDFGGAVPPPSLSGPVPFTLVLDADAGLAFAGSDGTVAEVALTKAAAGGLRLGEFPVNNLVDFTSLLVAPNATALKGKGAGQANVFCGDCRGFNGPFTATVTGAHDVTPPLLLGAGSADPFGSVSVSTSEPLPATATARIVGEDGTTFDLVPTIVPGDVPLVSGFASPMVVLPTGTGLSIPLDQLVDFAGLHGSADTPLRLGYVPQPPLLAEVGFESATGSTFGGATVVTSGPLPPITGARSVYVGPSCAPSPTGGAAAQKLLVRLAVPPGATKVVFSYEMVGPSVGAGGDMPSALVSVGSVGKMPASATVPAARYYVRQTPWPNGQTWNVGDVKGMELALPEVTSEVLVEIEALVSCGAPAGFSEGVLIDDLRLE